MEGLIANSVKQFYQQFQEECVKEGIRALHWEALSGEQAVQVMLAFSSTVETAARMAQVAESVTVRNGD